MMMTKTEHLEILEAALKKAARHTGRSIHLCHQDSPSHPLSLPRPWPEAASQKITEQKKQRKKPWSIL